MCLVLDGDTKFYHTIREEVTLASFRGLFESYKQAVLTAKAINVCCSVVTIKGPKKITKASRPRGKKESEDEKNFKDLVKALFGVNPGHCAEGAWTAEASDVMRRRPDYVPKFAADRALMEKVLGDPLFLPTPCTYVCPFASAVCTKPGPAEALASWSAELRKRLVDSGMPTQARSVAVASLPLRI